MSQVQLYLQILIRGWWIIALTTLSAINMALVSSYYTTPLYRTTAWFIVVPGPSLLASDDRGLLNGIEALGRRSIVGTYAEVMTSQRIYREVVNTAFQPDQQKLGYYRVNAVVLPDTSTIELSVEGPDPEIAALLANKIGVQAIDYIKSLYVLFDIDLLDPAIPPRQPFSPRPARDGGVAMVLGFVFGVILAILREQLGQLLPMLKIFGARPETNRVLPSTHPNASFRKRLEQELAHNQQGPLSLGLMQLDGLQDSVEKPVNAAVRRQILDKVTNFLCEEFPKDVILERWDNTSFAILLPAMSGSAAIRAFEHVQQALAQSIEFSQPDNDPIPLNFHAGITEYQGQSASILISQAETALEWSYQNGKKTVLYSNYR